MAASLLDTLAGAVGLVEAVVHLRAEVLAGPALLDDLLDHALEGTNAVTALPVAGEGVVARKRVAAEAGVRLRARMDLGVALEIVAAHKTLAAVVAAELAVAQVGLHVRLDVFFAPELLVAVFVLADPFGVDGVGAFDELGDVVKGHVGLLDGGADTGLQV